MKAQIIRNVESGGWIKYQDLTEEGWYKVREGRQEPMQRLICFITVNYKIRPVLHFDYSEVVGISQGHSWDEHNYSFKKSDVKVAI